MGMWDRDAPGAIWGRSWGSEGLFISLSMASSLCPLLTPRVGEGCSVKEDSLYPAALPCGSLQTAIIFFFPLSITFCPKLQLFGSKSGRYFFPPCCGRGQAPFRRSFKFRTTRAISLRTGIITFQFTHISAQYFLSMTLWTQVSILPKQIYKHLYLKKRKSLLRCILNTNLKFLI